MTTKQLQFYEIIKLLTKVVPTLASEKLDFLPKAQKKWTVELKGWAALSHHIRKSLFNSTHDTGIKYVLRFQICRGFRTSIFLL